MALWEEILTYNGIHSTINSRLTPSEIIFGYIQLLSIVLKIDVPWPDAWKVNLEWLNIFRFDLNIEIPNIPKLDFRSHFFIVVVLLPLGFTFFFLFMFKRKRVVVWYFALVGGICLMIAGGLTMLLPYVSTIISINGQWALIAGGIVVFCCLVMYLWSTKTKSGQKVFKEEDNAAEMSQWIEEDDEDMTHAVELPPPTLYRNVMIFLIWVACGVVGVLSLGLLSFDRTVTTPLKSLGTGVGYALLIIAGITFIYWIVLNTKGGRKVIESIRSTYRAVFLRGTLFLLALYYVPVTSTLASAWVGIQKSCPAGYKFESASLLPTVAIKEYTTDAALCTPCNFISGCSFNTTLCPAITDTRLAANLYLSFSQIGPFIWPVSAVMVIGFVLGVPALFYLLISKHNKFIRQIPSLIEEKPEKKKDVAQTSPVAHMSGAQAREAIQHGVTPTAPQPQAEPIAPTTRPAFDLQEPAPVDPEVASTETPWEKFMRQREEAKAHKKFLDDEWEIKVGTTKNSAKSLYMAFERRMRYYKLIVIIHKLAVVVVTVVLVQWSLTLSVIMMVVHFIFTVVSMRTQPYISIAQDLLATAASFCLFLSTLYAVLLGYGVIVPYIASFILLVANLVLPLLFWIIGLIVNLRRSSKRNAILKKKSDKVTEQVKIIDNNINNYTLKTMTNYFLILGILAFLSFIALFVAVLYDNTASNTIGFDYTPQAVALTDADYQKSFEKFEFANYAHWNDFTSNCCCEKGAASTDPGGREVLVEQWKCRNAITKLRLRKERDSTVTTTILDGVPLRPLCSRVFSPGVCTPTYAKFAAPQEQTQVQSGLYYRGIVSPSICLVANWTGPATYTTGTSYERRNLW